MRRNRSIVSFPVSFLTLLALTVPAANAAKDDAETIVVEDPHYGEILYYFYQEDYFPAIVRLLAAQNRQQLGDHAEEAELLLGGMYLSYGHHLEAAAIFERMLADNVSTDIRDRTWFFLAKIWYQRGYHEKSQQALGYIERALPKNLQREALNLQAQILIDSGEYDRAIALLQNWKDDTEWASYARFNIGVALVRSGRVEQARELLGDLGRLDPYNEELTSLRDKANLALGYALLQDGQPSAAKAPLQRVRLEGPFSNKALLGVGWADAEMDNYRRALVPWMELRSRDLLDSAVQESMLAIPYAMARLDSVSQAADHYLNAIEAFYEETNRLDRTIAHIESGDMFDQFLSTDPLDSTGWYWQLTELPGGSRSSLPVSSAGDARVSGRPQELPRFELPVAATSIPGMQTASKSTPRCSRRAKRPTSNACRGSRRRLRSRRPRRHGPPETRIRFDAEQYRGEPRLARAGDEERVRDVGRNHRTRERAGAAGGYSRGGGSA